VSPEVGVGVRIYALFVLAPVGYALPEAFKLPVLFVVAYLCVGLANRITNPETCPRCRNECQHEPLFGDLPAAGCSPECSGRPEEWPCLDDCPSRRNRS
jgi:hypothetical protein